jgi:hypothetical protein
MNEKDNCYEVNKMLDNGKQGYYFPGQKKEMPAWKITLYCTFLAIFFSATYWAGPMALLWFDNKTMFWIGMGMLTAAILVFFAIWYVVVRLLLKLLTDKQN